MKKLSNRTNEKSARAVGIGLIPVGLSLAFNGDTVSGLVLCGAGVGLISTAEYFRDFELPVNEDDFVAMAKNLDSFSEDD